MVQLLNNFILALTLQFPPGPLTIPAGCTRLTEPAAPARGRLRPSPCQPPPARPDRSITLPEGAGPPSHAGDQRLFPSCPAGGGGRARASDVALVLVSSAMLAKYLLITIGAAYPTARVQGFSSAYKKHRLIVPFRGVLCKVGSTFLASFPCNALVSDVTYFFNEQPRSCLKMPKRRNLFPPRCVGFPCHTQSMARKTALIGENNLHAAVHFAMIRPDPRKAQNHKCAEDRILSFSLAFPPKGVNSSHQFTFLEGEPTMT